MQLRRSWADIRIALTEAFHEHFIKVLRALY